TETTSRTSPTRISRTVSSSSPSTPGDAWRPRKRWPSASARPCGSDLRIEPGRSHPRQLRRGLGARRVTRAPAHLGALRAHGSDAPERRLLVHLTGPVGAEQLAG